MFTAERWQRREGGREEGGGRKEGGKEEGGKEGWKKEGGKEEGRNQQGSTMRQPDSDDIKDTRRFHPYVFLQMLVATTKRPVNHMAI